MTTAATVRPRTPMNPEQVKGLDLKRLPRWALWARLPLQPLAMVWVWRATRD